MTDHDPYGQPTRADLPAVDPTRVEPAVAARPPGGRPPRPPAGPPSGGGDRRWWIIAGLMALIIVIGIAALLVSNDRNDEATVDTTTTSATGDTTTTSSSTTTTTTPEATTTTEETTTTTNAPRSTIAPARCQSGGPDDPDASVQVLYEAYTVDDRVCAYQLGTEDAVDFLFAIPGRGSSWTYQGCAESEDTDVYIDCAYAFDGGATHFKTNYSELEGWQVFEVYQTVD